MANRKLKKKGQEESKNSENKNHENPSTIIIVK